MDIKPYEQMEAEFKEFYSNKIKPRLAEYEKETTDQDFRAPADMRPSAGAAQLLHGLGQLL